ncbi:MULTISPECIES: hypothetical protein [Bacillaceae]|uniref:hypothetical protein n=1 Tax=Bacillaceae TaxID=186817 RepID=UPI001C5830FC|nr:hypothetical protein [Rossellomorea sp. YZS02]MBW3114072.1 hypothetical protein [Bacillus sp. MCCB 382]MDX8342897.1 hypothetical protein [Rossellomorea sp. YZS02]
MTDRRDINSKSHPDFDDISDHIMPAQNTLPLIALGKNEEGKDEQDELSYIEGQMSRNQGKDGRSS